jgi:hypothetical protein
MHGGVIYIHVTDEYFPLNVEVLFTELEHTGVTFKSTNEEHVVGVLSILQQKSWHLVVLILNGFIFTSIDLMLIVPDNNLIFFAHLDHLQDIIHNE